MSEPRKNHLNIDGGQVKEDEHVVSYKPIPESETEFRSSKSNLSKSKASLDGAEEKLLPKAEEAKIVTRVDMADATYVVGDHRNGDAKIELDANKRQFSGLTKEELLKYANDPFWVNLRWFLFILFWAMWLCMLAGAIVIIVQAPKCAAPEPKAWFEKGLLVDMEETPLPEIEESLPLLKSSLVQGVFVDAPTYKALAQPDLVDKFKAFITKAKEYGVKVVVDLIPGFVSTDDPWFGLSENRTGEYDSYFVWGKGTGFMPNADETKPQTKPIPNKPNNWVSTSDTPAWRYSELRGEYYLQQNGDNKPDLNFDNPAVVAHFNRVLDTWMKAGAAGIRLNKARLLFVNSSMADEQIADGRGAALGAGFTNYTFWQHKHSADRKQLDNLLADWARRVRTAAADTGLGEPVFTLEEEERYRPELYLQRNVTSLRPPAAAPLAARDNVTALAADIQRRLGHWPLIQLKAPADKSMESELALFALMLPAGAVLQVQQLGANTAGTNTSSNASTEREALSHVVALRAKASLEHGTYSLKPVPPRNSTEYKLIACARWKVDSEGFVAVFNPSAQEYRANITALKSVPSKLTFYHASHNVKLYHNYSTNIDADDVLVPPKSTVVLNYVPLTEA